MIDLQENSINIQTQINYVCMNPNCSGPSLKFIGIQDLPKHKQCLGWFVKIQDMQQLLIPISQNISKQKKNILDFKEQPIKSLFHINKYFQAGRIGLQNINNQEAFKKPFYDHDPIHLLRQQFDQIRQKIQIELQKTFTQVEVRILNVKNVQENTINQIRRILTKIQDNQEVSRQICKSSILKQYKKFCQTTESLTLMDEGMIKKQLFKISTSISSIGNSFWKTQLQSLKREKQLFQKAYKEIYNLHNDSSVQPSIKLQNLQKMYQQKNFETCYSEDKSQIYVKCWVCNTLIFGQGPNIKLRKSSAYENLVNHLTTVHFEQTTAKFAIQMVKSSTHQLSYDEFLRLLEYKSYDQFIIVDRQNMSQNLSSMINQKIKQNVLIINVVAIGREKIAFGKYMVAMSKGKDSADTLMIILIYAIITSGYYRYAIGCQKMQTPKITLFTKDHFAQTYQEILKNGFGTQLNVVK